MQSQIENLQEVNRGWAARQDKLEHQQVKAEKQQQALNKAQEIQVQKQRMSQAVVFGLEPNKSAEISIGSVRINRLKTLMVKKFGKEDGWSSMGILEPFHRKVEGKDANYVNPPAPTCIQFANPAV
jgi:hypothetical protein